MKSEVDLSVARIRQRSRRDGAMPSWILLPLLCALIAPLSHASLIWDNNFGTQLVTANFLDQPGGSSNPSDGLQTVQLDPQSAPGNDVGFCARAIFEVQTKCMA